MSDFIAIDGKTLRGSYDKRRRRGAIHVISAFSSMSGVAFSQLKTAEKSNEITAILVLINLLDLRGKTVTTDAMGCQKISLRRSAIVKVTIFLLLKVIRRDYTGQ